MKRVSVVVFFIKYQWVPLKKITATVLFNRCGDTLVLWSHAEIVLYDARYHKSKNRNYVKSTLIHTNPQTTYVLQHVRDWPMLWQLEEFYQANGTETFERYLLFDFTIERMALLGGQPCDNATPKMALSCNVLCDSSRHTEQKKGGCD